MIERFNGGMIHISRSNPNDVVYITKDNVKVTRLEDLKNERIAWIRDDIGMAYVELVHCETCTCKTHEGKQYWVHPTASGEPVGEGLNYATDENLQWFRDENQRLIEIAKVHPEFNVYLTRKGANAS